MTVRRWNDPALNRLGALLQVRRIELDPRYHSRKLFGEETGINLRRIADLENGRRGGATPLALQELFAPAYGVTYESVLDVLNDRGGLEAGPGTPPHKPPLDRSREASPADDDEFAGVLDMLAQPGIDGYLAGLDAERRLPGWEPANKDELRIWLNPRLKDSTKRVLVAHRRLVWDQAVQARGESESAGLQRR